MLLTRDDCRALTEKIIKLAKGDDVAVEVTSGQNCNTRYANNAVTTAGFTGDLNVNIEVTRDKKTGAATTSELADATLERAVRQAEAIADLAPPDPEYVEPLGPQPYAEIQAFHEESAAARSAQLLPAVRTVIDAAEKKKVNAFGYLDVTARALALANKRGLFGYHRSTWASYSVTARTSDATGSGWAQEVGPRLSEVNSSRLGSTAIQKSLESRNPQRLEPGRYTVILEPAALAEMLLFLPFNFGARAADEGRSFLSRPGGGNLLGEKVFGENINLRSDPFNPRVPGASWDEQGLPAEKTVWVEKGVVKNLLYDRYWAQKNDKKPLPFPSNMAMDGGAATLDQLIASTERGLLVTRFWYIGLLQPQTLQLTGLTRDGVFYIEQGKIKHPVNNFRFNESTVNVLNNIEAMTAAVPAGGDSFRAVLPTVKVREFNMSSISDAV